MRANISFSVDFEKVPAELSRLVDHQGQEVMSKCADIIRCLSDGNFIKARESIFEARRALGNAEVRLAEIDRILAGYVSLQNGEVEDEQEPTNEDG